MYELLVLIALYSILVIKILENTTTLRQCVTYKINKFFRPFIIWIGGLNERTRNERQARASQFRSSASTEEDRRKEKSHKDSFIGAEKLRTQFGTIVESGSNSEVIEGRRR